MHAMEPPIETAHQWPIPQVYEALRATEALKRLFLAYARVLREGVEARVSAEGLVPGD